MNEDPRHRRRRSSEAFQSVRVVRSGREVQQQKRRGGGIWLVILLALLLVYFLGPLRTNLLILGTDDSPQRGALGRTDTIILVTVVPLKPYVGMLSIPRDLWLPIPDVGEQRINTAYFFAEAQQPGSGTKAAMGAIRTNFSVPVHYYALLHMNGVEGVIDALGGVEVDLPEPISGFPAGPQHFDGQQALAFVRSRTGSDDFARMKQGQILIVAALKKALTPAAWLRLPSAFTALGKAVDTNLPVWQWPRLGFAFLRAALIGIDSQTITREMVTPFTTTEGAQVLAPNWEFINPVVGEMFGR
jgi:LCP family protein required for cell wall assembly